MQTRRGGRKTSYRDNKSRKKNFCLTACNPYNNPCKNPNEECRRARLRFRCPSLNILDDGVCIDKTKPYGMWNGYKYNGIPNVSAKGAAALAVGAALLFDNPWALVNL